MGYRLFLIFLFVTWGLQHPILKFVAEDIAPITLNFFRFLSALVIVALVHRMKPLEQSPSFKEKFHLMLAGLIGIAVYGVVFMIGLRASTAVESSILLNTHPFFTASLAPFLLGETLSKRKLLGLVLGFTGLSLAVVNVSVVELDFFSHLQGNLLILLSAICISVFVLTTKHYSHSFGSYACNFYAMLGAVVGLLICMFLFEGGPDVFATPILSWLLVVFVGVVLTGIYWVLWVDAMKRLGVIVVGSYIFLIPLAGITFSAFLLGEPIHFLTALGAGFILSGIGIVATEGTGGTGGRSK